jgi:hypothetical protein
MPDQRGPAGSLCPNTIADSQAKSQKPKAKSQKPKAKSQKPKAKSHFFLIAKTRQPLLHYSA